jgi:hypothetical protein
MTEPINSKIQRQRSFYSSIIFSCKGQGNLLPQNISAQVKTVHGKKEKKHENLEVNPEHMNKIIFEERKP